MSGYWCFICNKDWCHHLAANCYQQTRDTYYEGEHKRLIQEELERIAAEAIIEQRRESRRVRPQSRVPILKSILKPSPFLRWLSLALCHGQK